MKGNFTENQYKWMIKNLKENKKDHTFVFFHKPTFDVTNFFPDFIMDNRQMGALMMEDFKKYKIDYVFSGHLHAYGRAARDGVVYITSGGAGSPLHLPFFAGGFFHYMKITVDNGKITDEVIKIYD